MKQISQILRAATRKPDEPLNILTFPTHERYETGLCKTGHNFWSIRGEGIKDWNTTYAPLPSNYVLLNPDYGDHQLPPELDFDLILSQNKFGQYQLAQSLSRQLQLPLVSLEHTLPREEWRAKHLENMKRMKGHYNIFISSYSRGRWGWDTAEASVIHHGVDTDMFAPNKAMVPNRKPQVLSVVNDWINRDWCCGFKLWQAAIKNLEVVPVGDTPGLSKPAKNTFDLIRHYRESQVFLNTSLISPVPTAMLEAMACGCAVVSTDNCMLPEVIEHGKNGYLTNDAEEMNRYCRMLLGDKELAEEVGKCARQTIIEKFSMDSFVGNWNRLFAVAADHVYVGPPQ